jgi:hypothetical protein
VRKAETAPLARVLERGRERATRAEDERLDRRLRQLQAACDLGVRETLPLTEEDRAPLLLGQARERVGQPDELVPVMRGRGDGLLQELDVLHALEPRTPAGRAEARQADVLGDAEEPRRVDLGPDSVLEAAAGVQVGGLERVLGLLGRAEEAEAVSVDPA